MIAELEVERVRRAVDSTGVGRVEAPLHQRVARLGQQRNGARRAVTELKRRNRAQQDEIDALAQRLASVERSRGDLRSRLVTIHQLLTAAGVPAGGSQATVIDRVRWALTGRTEPADSELLQWIQDRMVEIRTAGTAFTQWWLIRYPGDRPHELRELDSNETGDPGDLRTALRAARAGRGEHVEEL